MLEAMNDSSSKSACAGAFRTCRIGLDAVYATIESYYGSKVATYGATPRGVDWSCIASQRLRFVQLLKICDFSRSLSINDIGCGYGALIDFVCERYPAAIVDYLGIDLSPAMIRRARRRHRGRPGQRFVIGRLSPRIADYAIASGIMNVKLNHSPEEWEAFVAQSLRDMHATSRLGFAVNFMAELSSDNTMGHLYRATPDRWRRYCEDELGNRVEVLDSYGMREFTLLVRHDGAALGKTISRNWSKKV